MMNGNTDMNEQLNTTLDEASRQLRADLRRIFDDASIGAMLPVPVAEIESYDMAEDGETLFVWVALANGRTAAVSICPGRPITAAIVD